MGLIVPNDIICYSQICNTETSCMTPSGIPHTNGWIGTVGIFLILYPKMYKGALKSAKNLPDLHHICIKEKA